jgi:SAM-dependent methyltransferase
LASAAATTRMLSNRFLPDVSRLPSASAEEWAQLRTRLQEIGLTEEYVGQITRIGERLLDVAIPPLRNWHARRLREPAAYALRMLMLGDPVTGEEAQFTLGKLLLEKLINAGLIVWAEARGLVSLFRMVIGNDLYILCDDLTRGEDAVMGAGDTTNTLCQASHPTRSIERMLDLGCGAGSCALLFSSRAARAVGTDINSRAIILSKVNAALNGIANIDFRQGDLFAPVEGETFDLIVSQPPYYARPEGVAGKTFLYGGARGDEFPLEVLSQVPHYLSPVGRAVLLVEWPDIDGEPLEDRVRAVVPSRDANVLLLKYPSRGMDDYCTRYAAIEHPELGEDFAREAVLRREHFEKMGIRGLTMTLIVIQRNAEGLCWTSNFDVPAQDADWATSARIDKLISARDLLTAGRPNLLAACLQVPEGTVFARECRSGQPDQPKFTARFPQEALVGTVALSSGALLLLTLLDEAPDVRSAVQRFAERETLTFDEASERLLPALEEALLAGMLEVA